MRERRPAPVRPHSSLFAVWRREQRFERLAQLIGREGLVCVAAAPHGGAEALRLLDAIFFDLVTARPRIVPAKYLPGEKVGVRELRGVTMT